MSLFDIVGVYSIGVKITLKVEFTPMETTDLIKTMRRIISEISNTDEEMK